MFSEKISLNNLSVPPIFRQKYIPSLNGLRALSILFVLIGHSKFVTNSPACFIFIERYIVHMGFGVQMFYVISGFLITGLLLKEKAEHGHINLKNFYIRRAYRIFPVAFLFILTILLLKLFGVLYVSTRDLVCSATYVVDFLSPSTRSWFIGHLGTLSIEEQFYLLWPLALLFLPKRYYFIIIFIVLYYAMLTTWLYYHPQNSPLFLLKGLLLTAPALLCGALLAVGMFKGWFNSIHKILIHPLTAFSFILALAAYLPATFLVAGFYSVPFDFLLSNVFVAIFIYNVIHSSSNNIIYKFLNHPILNFIGILSYSIYIWQQPFFAPPSAAYLVHAWWAFFPQNFILTFLVATISYFTVEKAFLRIKKRYH